MDHLKAIVSFDATVFARPHSERASWDEFRKLKGAAEVDFPGTFHRLRFGFANANMDNLPPDVLRRLMRHKASATTQGYINKAQRMRTHGTADRLYVPATFAKRAGG